MFFQKNSFVDLFHFLFHLKKQSTWRNIFAEFATNGTADSIICGLPPLDFSKTFQAIILAGRLIW
jgi:hypothetical protein